MSDRIHFDILLDSRNRPSDNDLPTVHHRQGMVDPFTCFELGDRVILNAGQSGNWGPGTVTAMVVFDDGWEGYYIDFPITEDQSFGMGWIGSSLLQPASDDNGKDAPIL